ncbi:hypothetical protein EVAR_39740_1 [Eumeta japonica]|uniref:Uncharacterized protein n=1 Tax=Eumeta variegata TaxID=151549 RepID=A0A4C1X6P5_EUMVA|nr:hypothetical protein EVAR_39740_1 [Eumeta japonica]
MNAGCAHEKATLIVAFRLSRACERERGTSDRQRVNVQWMPQGGHLGIGNHVETQYGLNPPAGCRELRERIGLSTLEVSSSGGSERYSVAFG